MVGAGRTGQVGSPERSCEEIAALAERKGLIVGGTYGFTGHPTVLMHYDNGARGRLWVSSVNAGNMDSHRYRFVGSKASVEWSDSLTVVQ